MNDNLTKILFSATVLSLTFWGRGGDLLFPNLPAISQGSVIKDNRLLPQFKNQIFSQNGTALLAGGEVVKEPIVASSVISYNRKTAISIQAGLYLVADLESEENIFGLNETKRWPIASISKLMTAVVALENISESDLVTISSSAVETEGVAGGFSSGEIITSDDLVKALLTVSSNDAAVALAEHIGEEKFVNLMNAKAAALSMPHTFFREPTGLSSLNQSTLEDLKLLTRYIFYVHPKIFSYTRAVGADIIEIGTSAKRTLRNINKFIDRPDFLGGKTGYTDDAGENLVSLFARGNKAIIIIIVLDAQDRFEETLSALRQFDRL